LLPNASLQLLFVAPFFRMQTGSGKCFFTTVVSHSACQSVHDGILGINASVTAVAQSIPAVIAGYLAAQIVAQAPMYASLFIILSGVIF
jgi:hypothetical protein